MRHVMWIAALVAVATMSGALAQPANTTKPCKTWVDPVLRVEFPGEIAGLTMSSRTVYGSGDNNYSLRYDSEESARGESIGRCCDLYIYTRDGRPIPDGASEADARQIEEADRMVSKVYDSVTRLGMFVGGTLKKTGLKYLWTSYILTDARLSRPCLSVTVLTAWRDRFVKLRYSEAAPADESSPCESLPGNLLRILDSVDALFAEAIVVGKIDVYAIDNPTNALAALRSKWLGADTRVSMWEMPYYESRFFEIDELQDWCSEKKEERYGHFKDAVLEAIDMRIEPATWFYNLACARAVLGEDRGSVFDALEQAVAAGWYKYDVAKNDGDLASVTNDVRFAKLCEVMRVVGACFDRPERPLQEEGSRFLLSNDNVYYTYKGHSYLCCLETTNRSPIVYVNHHRDHAVVPCDGLIVPEFPGEAIELRRNLGPSNMHFLDAKTRECHPTVIASDFAYEKDRLNRSTSIPTLFGISRMVAGKEALHCELYNVLGVYAAASDYGADGIDRFIGFFPCCIAHTGGADESDKFVRLYRDIVRELRPGNRKNASVIAMDIIRHAQKCVTNETAFMSGIAQRPVLSFADIDAEKAISDAKTARNISRAPFIENASCVSETMAVTDLWDEPYANPCVASSVNHAAFVATWGEKTGVIDVEMEEPREWEYVWKVLQGDEGKVRIVPLKEDATHVRLEIDYHEAFDVALSNGKKVRTSRVDIGCFCVAMGRASVPAVVSVYFSPNETREYDADGRLVSIDYTKRQIDGWCPQLCAKGTHKDVFHWTKDGDLAGWTRYRADGEGNMTTNEFTRDGLVVVTRDAFGRPMDARRDLYFTWQQQLSPTNLSSAAEISWHGHLYDYDERDPAETVLAWEYEYESEEDNFGQPRPKKPERFKYGPALCGRAAFSEESGFRLPLIDQMALGCYKYAGYKHGVLDRRDWADELMRPDGRCALAAKGLAQPEVLKKMQFCPWRSSTNDLWSVDIDDWQGFVSSNLVELADGAYRLCSDRQERFYSVAETLTLVNNGNEHCAYVELDAAYERMPKGMLCDGKVAIADGAPLKKEELPKGVSASIAGWRVTEDAFFYIKANHDTDFLLRDYFFLRDPDEALHVVCFKDLPSPAIGNTVLRAFEGEAEAMNNLAVLLYSGVASSDDDNESNVVALLRRAAEKGCETASRNLEVFRYNRGEDIR